MKRNWLNIIGITLVVVAGIATLTYQLGRNAMSTGINLKNMDLTVRPGDDFYDYATTGWRAANPIPDDYSRYDVMDKLQNENLNKIKSLVKHVAGHESAHGTIEQKIGTLYNVAMDEKKLNADGIHPVDADLAAIDQISNRGDLAAFLGKFNKFAPGFWDDGVAPDMKDSTTYLFIIGQGGIGLPERDYYFDTESATIREKYKKYLTDTFAYFGFKGNVAAVYAIEERLAHAHYAKEKLRNPEENYHKFSYAEFKKKFGGFDWDAYFAARLGVPAKSSDFVGWAGTHPEYIDVGQPEALTEALKIIQTAPMADIRDYLKRNLIGDASPFLDDRAYELSFDFYNRTIAGQPKPKPRWKRTLAVLDGSLGEAVGQIYVKKYFPASDKARMVQLVENLRAAYAERIAGLTWMSDATKAAALEKLAAFRAKIGYPDKFRDYSKLEINNDSYFENMKRVSAFEDDYWLEKVGKPVDRELWHMTPQTINAYYDPQTNEICFPAGILQPPFFDRHADDAYNYGAIGSIIGHEMTHGFDDEGRKFDKDGNMRDWWTAADARAFTVRTAILQKQFDGILVAPGVHANGKFTMGENLADYGGVTISFAAFQRAMAVAKLKTEKGFTPAMRFFIAYGMTWAGNIRDAEILRRTKIDPHSLERNRVNGILPNVDAWVNAFDVKPGDKMYLAPESRVNIW